MEPMQIFVREIMKRPHLKEDAVKRLMNDTSFLERAVREYAVNSIQEGAAESEMEQFLCDALNQKDWATCRDISNALIEMQAMNTETVAVDVKEEHVVQSSGVIFR